jgi:tubulin-specific chaperone D
MPEGSEALEKVRGIIQKVESENLCKGKGGEIMRTGICHLIHATSISKINLGEKLSEEFILQLFANFKHPNNEIQDEATKSFESFCKSYFGSDVTIESSNPMV